MSNFRPVDRETGFLLPPSVEEWLPERHLARFVVEVIEQLDLSAFVKAISRLGLGVLSPEHAAGASGLRLRHGGVFEPQVGARDL